jgi:hypothetical protein
MSSGPPSLRDEFCLTMESIMPGVLFASRNKDVSDCPGETVFTLIPRGPSSFAKTRAICSMAPFVAR